MAILDLFECQVLVDGVPLQEYDDDEENGQSAATNFVMKYIEATSGANFAVKFHVMPGYQFEDADLFVWEITIDGYVLERPGVDKENFIKSKNVGLSTTRFGSRYGSGSEWFLRKFQFSEIATGEELDPKKLEELKLKCDQLGSIKVEVRRYQKISMGDEGRTDKSKTLGPVPEKALKGRALTIATRLSEAEKTEAPPVWKGRCLDAAPAAVFMFQYRSKESLKQLMIIPRTPSPTPLVDRPVEELSVEELRERLRHSEADAEAVRAQVKKEKAESNLYAVQAVKRCKDDMGIANDDDVKEIAEHRAHKKQRPAAGQEVVDLSD